MSNYEDYKKVFPDELRTSAMEQKEYLKDLEKKIER